MKRREFLKFFCGAAAGWPLAVRAQQEQRKIGILLTENAEPFLSTFKNLLHQLGYVEGQNIRYEVRSASGNSQHLPELANELVGLKVDIIVTVLTPAAIAAKQATANIPIVLAQAGDPVGNGLVSSLARPGGNVTGLSGTANEMGAKLLEVTRDILPSVARIGVLANANDPFTKLFVQQIEAAGADLAISIQSYVTHGMEEFPAAFAAIKKSRAEAVIIQGSINLKPAADFALEHQLPAVSVNKFLPAQGGLMSYGPNYPDLWRRAAEMVDKIFRGAKPADIPVEEPTKYELVVNLKTAGKLGIKVPTTLLLRADEVIE
jgi:putative ABC transport system substrate-binding protein